MRDEEAVNGRSNAIVDLSPNSWSYFRTFGRAWRAGWVGLPIISLGIVMSSAVLLVAGCVLSGVAEILAIRAQRNAYATRSSIHRRKGFFGFAHESIPITEVEDAWVDPLSSLFPGVGTLTLKCGPRYITCEGVSAAEEARLKLLNLRDRAKTHAKQLRGDAC